MTKCCMCGKEFEHTYRTACFECRPYPQSVEAIHAELASAKAVIEALRSVLSEDGVREHLAAFVMGVETMNRLDEFDARSK